MKESKERKNEIIRCAKEEFLKKGYEKASLRDICANADVTTGALYFYFKNKAELFDVLVRDVAIKLKNHVDLELNNETHVRQFSPVVSDETIRFILDNRESILLLVNKAKGTKYEGFLPRIQEQVTDVLHRYMEEYCEKEVDRELARVIARMRMYSYRVIVQNEWNFDETKDFVKRMRVYGRNGMTSLLDSIRDE